MKYEHGSPQWQAMVHTIFVERLAAYRQRKPEASGQFAFSMCEISTDAPKHLTENGQIAWTCRAEGGQVVSFSPNADPNADYVVSSSYAIMRRLGLFDTGGDPLRAKEYDDLCRTLYESGELTVRGTPPRFSREFVGMHDAISRLTA